LHNGALLIAEQTIAKFSLRYLHLKLPNRFIEKIKTQQIKRCCLKPTALSFKLIRWWSVEVIKNIIL
jgi:hypothetical protein